MELGLFSNPSPYREGELFEREHLARGRVEGHTVKRARGIRAFIQVPDLAHLALKIAVTVAPRRAGICQRLLAANTLACEALGIMNVMGLESGFLGGITYKGLGKRNCHKF